MSNDDLENNVRAALVQRNEELIYLVFSQFEREGGLQKEAYNIGMKLHLEICDTDEELDDKLLNVLDCVSGWCGAHSRIWKE